MKINFLAVGAFVIAAVILFSAGLFFIGDRHKLFSHHVDFYTELADVNGIAPGTKVRVSGFDAGDLEALQVPDRPSDKFRLKLHIDEKLRRLIRTDSVVSVESDGVVGDKFILIHSGTDRLPEASAGSTLPSKEPVEISQVIDKATGLMDQAGAAIGELKVKLGSTLDTTTATIQNANGLIGDARHGKGTIGMMLNDKQTADQLKVTVSNAQQASANINQLTVRAGELMSDVQSRNLPSKIDDTLVNARSASQQVDQVAHKVNSTLNAALGPDEAGRDAAANLRDTLSNVTLATANMADDTEALKHNFLLRGFFKKRGFYTLQDLTVDEYRTNKFFQNPANQRSWLNGTEAFTRTPTGEEELTATGKEQLDRIMGSGKEKALERPIIVEGYSTQESSSQQMLLSSSRSLLVARYLQKRFHVKSQNIAAISLNSNPPQPSGKTSWDGVCIVFVSERR